jgi:hypothetical protein
MKSLLVTGLMASTFLAFSGSAKAAPVVTFCGPSSGMGCETSADQMVFLQKADNVMLGFGNVGGPSNSLPTMDIHSDGGMLSVTIDLANGFATIKPNNGISFNGLDITIPGFGFTGLVFDTQDTPSGNPTDSFTVTDYTGSHVSVGSNVETAAANSDNEYSTNITGGVFDEVNFASLTGFDEVKHIEVEGLCSLNTNGTCTPVVFAPEPGSIAILGIGLLGLGMIRYRRAG